MLPVSLSSSRLELYVHKEHKNGNSAGRTTIQSQTRLPLIKGGIDQHLCFLLGFTPVNREWRSAAHFPLRQTWRFQLPYHKLSVPGWQYSIFASLWCYGIISQLIRYAKACSSYECFILRAARLSSKLLEQGYVLGRLKSSLRKFYGRYEDIIKYYEVSLS